MGERRRLKKQKKSKKNVHFITMFESEEIYSLKDMKGYQVSIKENSLIIPIKNERKSVEKEINFLRRKVDRFRIWKEDLTNMKEIIDVLNLENVKYAVQLKENNYLLWKFKKKWRLIANINFKYNIVRTEIRLTGRRKNEENLTFWQIF
jgi:hypothetical protein